MWRVSEAAMSEGVSLKEIAELVVHRRLWDRPHGEERHSHHQNEDAHPEPTSGFLACQRSKIALKALPDSAQPRRRDFRRGVEKSDQQNGIEKLLNPHPRMARFLSSTMRNRL